VRPPILLFEPNDLAVFDSSGEAEAWIEPPDVDLGPSFDADGQLLHFDTDGRRTFLRETGELRPEALRSQLVATFAAAGIDASPDRSLDELVTDARELFGRGVRRHS
jgi:sugar lactone lactonase YvrE